MTLTAPRILVVLALVTTCVGGKGVQVQQQARLWRTLLNSACEPSLIASLDLICGGRTQEEFAEEVVISPLPSGHVQVRVCSRVCLLRS